MNNLTITVVFKGGLGFVRFTFIHHGHVTHTVVIRGDDAENVKTISLEPGVYFISANGVSPDGGTDISFSLPVLPDTKPIPAGVITKAYALKVN